MVSRRYPPSTESRILNDGIFGNDFTFPAVLFAMKIFLVDDSLIVCARLITMLTDIDGVEIIGQARTPSDAVTSILRVIPDLIIMDIQMPGGTGIDVLIKIREHHCLAKVIIFTNFPYPQYRKKCEAAGADYFFDKSNEFESVIRVVEQMKKSRLELPERNLNRQSD